MYSVQSARATQASHATHARVAAPAAKGHTAARIPATGPGASARGLAAPETKGERDLMSKLFGAAVVLLAGLWPGAASAQSDCVPYCDFNHDYGPRDFTW